MAWNALICLSVSAIPFILTDFFQYNQLRSSHPEMFCKKGILKNSAKFKGKHLYQSLFFNKVAGHRPQACSFIKKETLTQVFSCEFCEHVFLQDTSGGCQLQITTFSGRTDFESIKNNFGGVHSFARLHTSEAFVQKCSVKKVFLNISQNPHENTCARVSFLIRLQAKGLQLH